MDLKCVQMCKYNLNSKFQLTKTVLKLGDI